jgi:hypothetical protein
MIRYQEALSLIEEHHQDVTKALEEYFGQMFNGDFHNRLDLAGSSEEKLQKILDSQLRENKLANSMTVLAAVESWFRTDFISRVDELEKSTVGQIPKEMCEVERQLIEMRKRTDKVSYTKILDFWQQRKQEAQQKIQAIKDVVEFRNWLAHGRAWELSEKNSYDYSYISDIANNAIKLLNSMKIPWDCDYRVCHKAAPSLVKDISTYV